MTIYNNFKAATEELERDLLENGQRVANTLELTNVHYTVSYPHLKDLTPHLPWADKEFEDRISIDIQNPGNAWKDLPEVWKPMMEKGGLFSYTYNERMIYHLEPILYELNHNVNTREAFLSIWNPALDTQRLSMRRVPCTIGYQFLIRDNKLHLTYLQRSCNFKKHYQDDVYLARKFQEWVASQLKGPIASGGFSHWVGSLHIFIT